MKARKSEQAKPCPYDIPPAPQLDPETLKKLDLWNALEFFRVEALLRSKSVWTLYQQASRRKSKSVCPVERRGRWKLLSSHVYKRKGESASTVLRLLCDETLRTHVFIDDGWLVLWGAHHRYLRPDPYLNPPQRSRFDISDGILDLSALARAGKLDLRTLSHNLQKEQKLFLYLRINCAVAPEPSLNVIRSLLQDKHRAVTVHVGKPNIDPCTGMHTFPFHPRKDPPITEVRAWLKYLQCYDLRHRDGLTDDAIATKVYGNEESGGAEVNAKQAVRRFTLLIAAAEKNAWPPTNLSSAKKRLTLTNPAR